MKSDLDDLDELSIVYLAMGLIGCPAMPRLSQERLLKLSCTKAIHDAAKEIVLRELLKIANRQIGQNKDAAPFCRKRVVPMPTGSLLVARRGGLTTMHKDRL